MPMLNIGSTKQLFFDDYLIESLINAKQGLNSAVKVDDNPILRPERPWEGNFMRPIKVIFDPTDQIFKMWYSSATITVRLENGKPVPGGAAGLVLDTQGSVMCLATSEDGIHWDRPSLGLVQFDGSMDNNILPTKEGLPPAPAFQDLHEKDPAKRYKALIMIGDTQKRGMQYNLFYSPDGIHWTPYEGNPGHRYRTGVRTLGGSFPRLGFDTRNLLRHYGSKPPLAGTLRQTAYRQGRKPRHDSLERAGDYPCAGQRRLPRH